MKEHKLTARDFIPLFVLGCALLGGILFSGCAALSPGADPFVVRVEQGQAGAGATFDMVLNLDNSNRPFWMTNAPGFHNFCEWLRTPTTYGNTPTTVPRCVAIQLNVDDLKAAYRASKTSGNSNALYSASTVLITALGQASSWLTVVTNSVHP